MAASTPARHHAMIFRAAALALTLFALGPLMILFYILVGAFARAA